MGTRSAILLKKNDNIQKFYRHWDGNPNIAGVELLTIANKHGFDYDKVRDTLLAYNEIYQPVDAMPFGVQYEYTIDCTNGCIFCMDLLNEESIDVDMFHYYNSDRGLHIEPGTSNSDSLNIFDYGFSAEDEYLDGFVSRELDLEEMAAIETKILRDRGVEPFYERKPFYPVDMQNPAELTPEQMQRGDKLFDTIIAFMESHPDDGVVPMLCITQEWDISIDYGGHRCDSDFVHFADCVMCLDDEGWYPDRDYMRQCVPYLEAELREAADLCMEMYGEVSSHRELHNNRASTLQFAIQNVAYAILDSGKEKDIVIAVDTITQDVYGWPLSEGRETYGGIIQFYSIADLAEKGADGTLEISIDKIESIVRKLASPLQ